MTAVEWQFNELQKIEKALTNKVIDGMEFIKMKYEILEKAKEMEKEQIKDAFDECGMWQDNYSDSEHYYNKTFKSL